MNSSRLRQIVDLALPIVGGMVSQNVLNLVDTAMVGALDNPNPSLAAVNQGGFANFMFMALLLGISTGVQATASRRKGEGKHDRTAVSLNAGILLVLIVAPIFSAVLYFLVPTIFPLLNPDPEVVAAGVPYLQARVLAISFVAINFAFRGYWNAINRSWFYMGTLMVMHAANIFMNWVLITGNLGFPALGAQGAGIATALSTVIATSLYFFLGITHAKPHGFLSIKPSRAEFRTLVRLSLPNGIQQLFFSAGYTALFWIIARVGVVETAAAGVLINLTLVAILPGIALGLSAATLVGQALGRKDVEDAKRWGWDVVKVGLVVLGCLGLPMIFLTDFVLAPFARDPLTVEAARWPLRMVGLTIALESVGLVLMNSMLGAGASKRVMQVSIVTQWFFFLPIAFVFAQFLGWGLLQIWGLQVTYRALMSGTFAWLWHRGNWAGIEV